ncbi:MAG: D-alanyl-D-alanine carboxypeptidase family protein [Eubacteriales bacterium]|nr:D-alanyl-D-alanine carboxypeptidase family protein [Eubacteriales bacterium]
MISVIICRQPIYAAEQPEQSKLYSMSAAVIDGENGRVLFEKNGNEIRPMASTTKIMTLIVTLENSDTDQLVTISSYASKMPDVQLNVKEHEQYRLIDLIYSMMLESHNDSAVAIAEHVAGSVDGFANMMNAKAREIGLSDTYFITSNGLDATDEQGTHSTTAIELSKIMRYCTMISPQKDKFIEICQTMTHTFSDYTNHRTFTVNNKNKMLTMMDGVLAGKTGFTADAGYCYVVAIEREDKTIMIALLGCGWPSNKNYKWKDTLYLSNLVFDNYQRKQIWTKDEELCPLYIFDGEKNVQLPVGYDETVSLLLCDTDCIDTKVDYYVDAAPIEEGDIVGKISIYVNDALYQEISIYAQETIRKKTLTYYLDKIIHLFL